MSQAQMDGLVVCLELYRTEALLADGTNFTFLPVIVGPAY
jgi:hypothetical protein